MCVSLWLFNFLRPEQHVLIGHRIIFYISDTSALVKVIYLCPQPRSYNKNQCWQIFLTPCGVTKPQWFNYLNDHHPLIFNCCQLVVASGHSYKEYHWDFKTCAELKSLFLWHDDVIKWKHFPRYWPFVRGIHRSPVNSPYKGQWRGALMFSLICVWINAWVNNREAGDLRRYQAHYDVTVMMHKETSLD